MKICSRCKEEKSLECFSPDRSSSDGKYSKCKSCANAVQKIRYMTNPGLFKEQAAARRKANRDKYRKADAKYRAKNPERIKNISRKYKYGLASGEFDIMLWVQSGKCAICAEMMRPPHIDHCHKTKKVRALLCRKCNTGIGQFDESIDRLEAAIGYLKLHHCK